MRASPPPHLLSRNCGERERGGGQGGLEGRSQYRYRYYTRDNTGSVRNSKSKKGYRYVGIEDKILRESWQSSPHLGWKWDQ